MKKNFLVKFYVFLADLILYNLFFLKKTHNNVPYHFKLKSNFVGRIWPFVLKGLNQNPTTPSGPGAFQFDNFLTPERSISISMVRSFCFSTSLSFRLTLPNHSASAECFPGIDQMSDQNFVASLALGTSTFPLVFPLSSLYSFFSILQSY